MNLKQNSRNKEIYSIQYLLRTKITVEPPRKKERFRKVINVKNMDIRGVLKKYREFCVFLKIIYLFMNIFFVSFKVIPTRYYTLAPMIFPILDALQKIIFCDLVQLLLAAGSFGISQLFLRTPLL